MILLITRRCYTLNMETPGQPDDPRQVHELIGYLATLGTDLGPTGATDEERPIIDNLIEGLKAGKVRLSVAQKFAQKILDRNSDH